MDDEELARIKTAWSSDRQRTHSEGCRQWHPECAVVGLVGEVERLRGQVDDVAHALDAEQDEVVRLRERNVELLSAGPVDRTSWDKVCAELADVKAERDRLLNGILRHRNGIPHDSDMECPADRRLWALLEEDHDG